MAQTSDDEDSSDSDDLDLDTVSLSFESLSLAQEDDVSSGYGDEGDDFSIGTTTEAQLALCDDAEGWTEWESCMGIDFSEIDIDEADVEVSIE